MFTTHFSNKAWIPFVLQKDCCIWILWKERVKLMIFLNLFRSDSILTDPQQMTFPIVFSSLFFRPDQINPFPRTINLKQITLETFSQKYEQNRIEIWISAFKSIHTTWYCFQVFYWIMPVQSIIQCFQIFTANMQ